MKKVFDRNGRVIRVGDRVKIIGEKVAELLRDSYGDNLPEGVLSDEDIFGTAQIIDGAFQVADDNGEMLWDLSFMMEDGDTDSYVEVVED